MSVCVYAYVLLKLWGIVCELNQSYGDILIFSELRGHAPVPINKKIITAVIPPPMMLMSLPTLH